MKTLIRTIARTESTLIRDTFVVLLGISLILGSVMLLDFLHIIKAYSWQ